MSGLEFDWFGDDDESVVVETQDALAVYTNRCDQVVLRQRGDSLRGEDHLVAISPEYLPRVVLAMLKEAGIPVEALLPARPALPPPAAPDD